MEWLAHKLQLGHNLRERPNVNRIWSCTITIGTNPQNEFAWNNLVPLKRWTITIKNNEIHKINLKTNSTVILSSNFSCTCASIFVLMIALCWGQRFQQLMRHRDEYPVLRRWPLWGIWYGTTVEKDKILRLSHALLTCVVLDDWQKCSWPNRH